MCKYLLVVNALGLRTLFYKVIPILISVTVCACAHVSSENTGKTRNSTDQMASGCRGGVTGGSNGLTLMGDGTLIEWNKATARHERKEKNLGKVDLEMTNGLFSKLEQAMRENIQFHQPFNVTCFIILRTPEFEYSVEWPMNGPYPPQQIMQVYDQLRALENSDGQRTISPGSSTISGPLGLGEHLYSVV